MAGQRPPAAGPRGCATRLGGRLPAGPVRPRTWLCPPAAPPAGAQPPPSLLLSPRASRSLSARRSLPLPAVSPPSAAPRGPRPCPPSRAQPPGPPSRAPSAQGLPLPAPRRAPGASAPAPGPALPQRLAPHQGSGVRGQDRFQAPSGCSWGGELRVKYFLSLGIIHIQENVPFLVDNSANVAKFHTDL